MLAKDLHKLLEEIPANAEVKIQMPEGYDLASEPDFYLDSIRLSREGNKYILCLRAEMTNPWY